MSVAERRWTEALATWAVPDAMLAHAPQSPWVWPVSLFKRADDRIDTRRTAPLSPRCSPGRLCSASAPAGRACCSHRLRDVSSASTPTRGCWRRSRGPPTRKAWAVPPSRGDRPSTHRRSDGPDSQRRPRRGQGDRPRSGHHNIATAAMHEGDRTNKRWSSSRGDASV